MDSPLKISILTYLIFAIIIIVLKPAFIFNPDRTLKTTGIGVNNTLFSLPVILITGSILFYFFYTVLFSIINRYYS